MSCPSSLTMRLYRHVFSAIIVFLATPSVAEPSGRAGDGPVANDTKPQEPDTDIFALMSGKCSTLKIAGRNFACKTGRLLSQREGRTNFTIAVDDPADSSHVISSRVKTAGARGQSLRTADRPDAAEHQGSTEGRRPAGAGGRGCRPACASARKLRAADRSPAFPAARPTERQEVRVAVRVRWLADDYAQGQALRAVDPGAPVQMTRGQQQVLPCRRFCHTL